MILLALDASTTACGWCLMEDGEWQESGVWKPPPKLPWWQRVQCYEASLGAWIWRLDIDTVVYELATGNKGNMHTNRLLGAVEYVTRRACLINPTLITVTASQVIASGCHKHALYVASAIAGREVTSGDEADSIGCGLAGWKKIREERLMEAK